MRATVLFAGLLWMCEGPPPELPCGGSEGMLIEWTLDGAEGSACWADTASSAVIDERGTFIGVVTEDQIFSIAGTSGEPVVGDRPPCAYGPVLVWETSLAGGGSGSISSTPPRREDNVSEVAFHGRLTRTGGAECGERLTPTGGTWRVWEGGTWGDPLLLELSDLTYPTVDGHTLVIRRVLWRGTITATPVHFRPGWDAGAHDAGTL